MGVRVWIDPNRDSEVGHDGIARILIDVAAVFGNEITHRGEVTIENFGKVFGRDRLGDRSETSKIGEKDRDHTFFAGQAEAVGIGLHVGEDLGADHGGEHAADASFFALFENELVAETTDAAEQESEARAHCRKDETPLVLYEEGQNGVAQADENQQEEPENRLFGCKYEEESEQGGSNNQRERSPIGREMKEASGESCAKGSEVDFRPGHWVGVGGANDVFRPVSVRTDENDLVLEHLSVLENFFPSSGNKELVDGNRFVVEVGWACKAKDA